MGFVGRVRGVVAEDDEKQGQGQGQGIGQDGVTCHLRAVSSLRYGFRENPALLDRGHGLGLLCFFVLTACAPLPPPEPPPSVPVPVRELVRYEEDKRAEAGCPLLRWLNELEPVAEAYLQTLQSDSAGPARVRLDVGRMLREQGVAFHRFSVLEGRADAGWIMVETWRSNPGNRQILEHCLNTHTAVATSGALWVQMFIQSASAQQTRIP